MFFDAALSRINKGFERGQIIEGGVAEVAADQLADMNLVLCLLPALFPLPTDLIDRRGDVVACLVELDRIL
jgi:hypothetical protein